MKRGFAQVGTCNDPSYPSGVLLQKPTSEITYPANPQFARLGRVPAVFSAARPDDPAYAPFVLGTVDPARLIPQMSAGLVPAKINQFRFGRRAVRELAAAAGR